VDARSTIPRARRVAARIVWLSIGILLRSFGGTQAQTHIVVTRYGERFRIHPDSFDEFKFRTGDRLVISPAHHIAGVSKTPDQHLHLRRNDGQSIRVPPYFVNVPYGKYEIPEHLMILTGAGASSWEAIGKKHVSNYVQFTSLVSGMFFLEIGCGIGRDALQLIDLLGPAGRYIGIDVTRDSIVWCRKNVSRVSPNFEFYHFDAWHELYNPLGTKTSLDFVLPVPDKSVDRIALGSVFTHLFEPEIVHYLKEIARVLKPSGLAYATFFLYSDEIVSASRRNNRTPYGLRFEHPYADGCFVNDVKYPTGAVAFTDEAMRRMIGHAGLRLAMPYLKGWWSGFFAEADDGQEVAILASR
jgi:SAM-dependent methyltransferase